MLTADTVTDEQIRALRVRLGSETYAGSSYDAVICNVAIAAPVGSLRRAQARARCAEIVNLRATICPRSMIGGHACTNYKPENRCPDCPLKELR